MEQNKSKTNTPFLIILLLLLLVSLVGGGLYWQQNDALSAANKDLNVQVASLSTTKAELLKEIETLQTDYNMILAENDGLAELVERTTKKVNAQKAEIKKIKQSTAKDASEMQTEITQLRAIKNDINAYVAQLQAENTRLKADNQILTAKVASVEAENRELAFQVAQLKQLTGQLEKENSGLMATATRATDLRIDIRKKGDKPTGSFRRAREINVSFALNNVPANRKGDQKIYVVIKDAQGVPVKVANPIKAIIKSATGGKSEEIIAQQMQVRNLFDKVRLQMKVNPEIGNLRAGYYRVAVYADWGLLGGAQFQLR